MQINKKTASTLAEVMITLVIIGVVAGLTVPVLKKHTQREETVVKLKKGYMSLEQAIDAAIVDNSDIQMGSTVKWDMSKLFTKYMVPELLIVRDCSAGGIAPCFPSSVTGLGTAPTSAVVMGDGIAVGNSGMDFYIDVNNLDLPNHMGVDVFQFTFEKVGADPAKNEPGSWKFVPKGDAQRVINDGWKITYW